MVVNCSLIFVISASEAIAWRQIQFHTWNNASPVRRCIRYSRCIRIRIHIRIRIRIRFRFRCIRYIYIIAAAFAFAFRCIRFLLAGVPFVYFD